jgi:prevent-host-death family protein
MAILVSATDANRQFSELLAQAADGETVIITRRGAPIAQLTKIAPKALDEAREQAWARLFARMEEGVEMGDYVFDRDSLYDR